jgi:hypothetical protein
MLNLSYLENGKLETKNNNNNNNKKKQQQQQQASKAFNNKRRTTGGAQGVCYEILSLIYKMNIQQDEFQHDIKGQRHCNILQKHNYSNQGKGTDNRHETIIKRVGHRLYRKDAMATTRIISDTLRMNHSYVSHYTGILRMMDMIDYDTSARIYTIKPKGIEFIIVWEDVKRLFATATATATAASADAAADVDDI